MTTVPDKENAMRSRLHEIAEESEQKRARTAWVEKRKNELYAKIRISGISMDSEKFISLLEKILSDSEVTSCLKDLIQAGVSIAVEYEGLMKERLEIVSNGMLKIADTATLEDIRKFLGLPPSVPRPRGLSGNIPIIR